MDNQEDNIEDKLRKASWAFPKEPYDCLSDYEKSFFELELTGFKTFEYYKQRLRMLGFCGMEKILDAACGMGQWSAVIADLNGHVEGVDIDVGRLLISRELCREMGKQNARFSYASIDSLPFVESTFQGVFCYGAFMFADMPATLKEFNRVLRPSGQLYINVNMAGWYAHLLIDRGIKQCNLGMVRTALNTIRRTLMGKASNIVVRRKWLERTLKTNGFRIQEIGPEGCINVDDSLQITAPAYASHHYKMPAVLEVLAEKA